MFIAAYREVTDTTMAYAATAPTMADFSLGLNTRAIPAWGTPFDPADQNEPMVAGVPLVIGTRKGFPNFNEFFLQTEVAVTRRLEFTNKSSDVTIRNLATNQMYLVSISNSFGVEAWNPYTNPYPRSLQMMVTVRAYTTVTNERGLVVLTNNPSFSAPGQLSVLSTSGILPPPITAWPGYDRVRHPLYTECSFFAPFHPDTNHFVPLPSASFSSLYDCFVVPYQTSFEALPIGPTTGPFPVPHWYLLQKKRVLFVLVDTVADRIVDYVNLASDDPPLDVTTALFLDSPVLNQTNYLANGWIGSLWLTNRGGPGLDSDCSLPTYGILNQINVSLGTVASSPPWMFLAPPFQSPYAAINFFRTNLLGWSFINMPTSPLYLTNRFYSPYLPTRTNYILTWWQANDPLTHYTVNDLQVNTNLCFLSPNALAFGDVGGLDPAYLPGYVLVGALDPLNARYEPWGGHPGGTSPGSTDYQLAVKDSLVTCSDDWDFPTGQSLDIGWVGRVHRGTPWQTIYLKSADIDFSTWARWAGNYVVATNWGQIDPGLAPLDTAFLDAALTAPTNDWRLAGLLASLFSTNSPQHLLSLNEPSVPAWCGVMDGITVLTNTVPDDQLLACYPYSQSQFDAFLMQSNAPQTMSIAGAIAANRSGQPGHYFRQLGDLLAVPELTVGSPCLTNGHWAEVSPFLNLGSTPNPAFASLTIQQTSGINDAAYEAIPSQLLARCGPIPSARPFPLAQTCN